MATFIPPCSDLLVDLICGRQVEGRLDGGQPRLVDGSDRGHGQSVQETLNS